MRRRERERERERESDSEVEFTQPVPSYKLTNCVAQCPKKKISYGLMLF